jgi:hypothetical protein
LRYRKTNAKDTATVDSYGTYTDDMLSQMMLGYDYTSLLVTLSSRYCMCDLFEGYLDYQPLYSGLFDLSSMMEPVSHMEKARNNLSTLKIPKASHGMSCEEQLTPTTLEGSPTLAIPGDATFTQCSKNTVNPYQMSLGTTFMGF